MGTNYYLVRKVKSHFGACEHCSETEEERVHLGKSSIGWRFGFKADPAWSRSNVLNLWLDLSSSGRIEDEYGEVVPRDALLALIMGKQDLRSHQVDHGPDITGPHFAMFKDRNFDCNGFDFTDSDFS